MLAEQRRPILRNAVPPIAAVAAEASYLQLRTRRKTENCHLKRGGSFILWELCQLKHFTGRPFTIDFELVLFSLDNIDSCQRSYRLAPSAHGLSHGLKIAQRFAIFAPVRAPVPAFQVLVQMQKNPTAKAVGFFWQGHKDLNPETTVLEAFPYS